MGEILLIYLWTRLHALTILCGLSVALALICVFVGAMNMSEYGDESDGHRRWTKFRNRAAIIALLMGMLVALIPSKQDVAIIVGGKLSLDAIRSPEAREIGGKVKELLYLELDNAIARAKAPNQEEVKK